MSEPQHISEILPAVMADIRRRMDRQSKSQRRSRIISAVGDFMLGWQKRPERQGGKKEAKREAREKILF
ncbi:MAG: hypothetical protein CEE38_17320 [Planctomycetes bacterium B3_Pla]|nr:MAG: hypothetical protein CEE38_17320 [Planctomycetes bacterium B3_Pla]